jgi:aryl-alcohol dehydrogenase-like predicted oxidoreductase
MQKQKLGMTDIEVSALVLGTDLIGTRITSEQSFILFDYSESRSGRPYQLQQR